MSPPLSDEQAARVEAHTKLVHRAAHQVYAHTSVLSFEELESVGNEALVRAAMRYDPSSPASFATYAHYRVRGAMIDAIRARTPGRRKQKRALSRLQATQALLSEAAEDQAARRSAGDLQTLTQRVAAARELVRRASMVIEMSESVPVSTDVVAADDVFLAGWEYHYFDPDLDPPGWYSQIPEGFVGRPCPVDPHKADASPWLDRLPVVREFRRKVLAR